MTAAERQAVSAVVVSYNRADIIGTCLRALSFADELIVVDKSSTDGTPEIAATLADRVISIPWSPTVEESRAFAVDACAHDWILCLDDDECLSPEAARFIQDELIAPRADIYALPQRHYILGVHDEAAYYWPEYQVRFFRRGAVTFRPTVHGGTVRISDRLYRVPPDSGACLRHLSHRDVTQWLEKTNRYTSRPDRKRADDGMPDLAAFAHDRIDHWLRATKTQDRGGYPAAVALLRAVYDIVDRLKAWETEAGLDGEAAFGRLCRTFDAEYAAILPPSRPGRAGEEAVPAEFATAAEASAGVTDTGRLENAVSVLAESLRVLRQIAEQGRRDSETTARNLGAETARAQAAEHAGREREEACRAMLAQAEIERADARGAAAQARQIALNALRHQARLRETHTAELAAITERVRTAETRARTAEERAKHAELRARVAQEGAETAERLAETRARDAADATERAQSASAGALNAAEAARTAHEALDRVLQSGCWRATAPLRAVTSMARRSRPRTTG